jgi:hypothetical protein
MSLIAVTATIHLDTRGRDPEEVCAELNSGLDAALAHFPGGEVLDARVESAREMTDEEIADYE